MQAHRYKHRRACVRAHTELHPGIHSQPRQADSEPMSPPPPKIHQGFPLPLDLVPTPFHSGPGLHRLCYPRSGHSSHQEMPPSPPS